MVKDHAEYLFEKYINFAYIDRIHSISPRKNVLLLFRLCAMNVVRA